MKAIAIPFAVVTVGVFVLPTTKSVVANDIIIFVTGKESSNGKILSALCRNVNPRTYVIGRLKEIDSAWFRDGDRVGVCGATSTPKWALEAVAHDIEKLDCAKN